MLTNWLCAVCRTVNVADSFACSSCGRDFELAILHCLRCGLEMPGIARTCLCGASLGGSEP